MKLDILAFGAHPDDVELSCCGTLMTHIAMGKKVGVVDLTQGELGSRGTIETRRQETEISNQILGIHARENLKMQDGFFENNKENQLKVIEAIRFYQPEIVFLNAPTDRHPDHGKGAQLVKDACFLSGLLKIETTRNGETQAAWRPKKAFHYIQDQYLTPTFSVDITSVMDRKIQAIQAFGTQFFNKNANDGPKTYISTSNFLEGVKARCGFYGKLIGVPFAEGFISTGAGIGFANIFDQILPEIA